MLKQLPSTILKETLRLLNTTEAGLSAGKLIKETIGLGLNLGTFGFSLIDVRHQAGGTSNRQTHKITLLLILNTT